MQSIFSIKASYNESENALISAARSVTDKIAGFFAENETAMVIKKFREMDPSFQVEPFLREMREYILPEVLDAYVRGDTSTLSLWLSAAQYQVYAALAQQYKQQGLKSDGRILDIRHVDILSARMLEPGEIPVFVCDGSECPPTSVLFPESRDTFQKQCALEACISTQITLNQ